MSLDTQIIQVKFMEQCIQKIDWLVKEYNMFLVNKMKKKTLATSWEFNLFQNCKMYIKK